MRVIVLLLGLNGDGGYQWKIDVEDLEAKLVESADYDSNCVVDHSINDKSGVCFYMEYEVQHIEGVSWR